MALNTALANSVGTAIANELAALPRGSDVSVDAWKIAVKKIFDAIVASGVITVTVPASSIVTTGSAATQTGPAAPVPLTGTIA